MIRYDAHCHLMNMGYVALEAREWLSDKKRGQVRSAHQDSPNFPSDPIESIGEFFKWIKGLAVAGFRSEEYHLKVLNQAARKFWGPDAELRTVPLMMDIYFLFSPPVLAGQSAPKLGVRGSFWWRLWQKYFVTKVPYFDTPGFHRQRRQLEILKRNNPSSLFPFFAVDPRRTGIIAEVCKGELVGKDKPFRGIKLYPRLGVHPQAADLDDLYKWCVKTDTPIITHTDIIGFPTEEMENLFHVHYGFLGDPDLWVPILQKYPSLRIDFAHFGMSEPSWPAKIIQLMKEYPHVYSDLSCYTTREVIAEFKKNYWDPNPIVQERTFFGTDYDVNIAVSKGLLLDEYFENFRDNGNVQAKSFNAVELQQLSNVNPVSFLP